MIIQENTIIHGDSLTVLRQMEPESVDAIITDPPYGINYVSQTGASIKNDKSPFIWFLYDAFRVLKSGEAGRGGLICFTRWDVEQTFIDAMKIAGFNVKSEVIWDTRASRPKTRRRQECTGQTGYTMHILDGIVTEVLHQVFDKMQGASNDMIVGSAVQKQMAMIRSELQRARAENTKANKEYESLKAEVLKAIQGKSALPQDVLTEMLEDTRQKVLSTSERITTLTAELNDGNSKIEEMKAEFNRIVSWSKIFDESPMEVKKMICGYIIKKVSVFRDYRIKIEFNINVEQFLNGIDSIDECDTYELPMAQ